MKVRYIFEQFRTPFHYVFVNFVIDLKDIVLLIRTIFRQILCIYKCPCLPVLKKILYSYLNNHAVSVVVIV